MRVILCFSVMMLPFAAFAQIVWNDPIHVATAADGANRPQIAVDATGNPHIIWGKAGGSLLYARWNGNAFTTPMRLNPSGTTIAQADWMGPAIAAHGDTLYVVYKQTPEDSPNSHVWCLHSYDAGLTWSAPVRVEYIQGDGKSRFPVVTTDDSGHPIVGYMKFNPSFGEARWVVTRSDDYGASFSGESKASGWSGPDSEVCDCCPGSLESDGQTVVMLYRDNNEHIRDSWVGISHDGGNTFTEGKNIDQQHWEIHACPSTGPTGVLMGDTLYSAFMNAASGAGVVYYNASSLSADTVPPALPVDGFVSGRVQNFPAMANYGSAMGISWREQFSGASQLLLAFTENIQQGFPANVDTVTSEFVTQSDIALTDAHVYVVWQSETTGTVRIRRGTYREVSRTTDPVPYKPLHVYPNPVYETLYTDQQAETVFYIYNQLGQKVKTTTGNPIYAGDLLPGMYVIRSSDSGAIFIKK